MRGIEGQSRLNEALRSIYTTWSVKTRSRDVSYRQNTFTGFRSVNIYICRILSAQTRRVSRASAFRCCWKECFAWLCIFDPIWNDKHVKYELSSATIQQCSMNTVVKQTQVVKIGRCVVASVESLCYTFVREFNFLITRQCRW